MITNTSSRNYYVGNGSTATYNFTFPTVSPTEVTAFTINGSAYNPLNYGTDFTVTQNSDLSTGGTITLTAGVLAINVVLSILRVVPETQTFSFDNNGPFYPNNYEKALDALTKQVQYLQAQVTNCLQIPIAETQNTVIAPDATSRANTVAGFDANGNFIATAGVTPVTVPVSGFWATMLNIGTQALSLVGLGISTWFQTLLSSTSITSLLNLLNVPNSCIQVNVSSGDTTVNDWNPAGWGNNVSVLYVVIPGSGQLTITGLNAPIADSNGVVPSQRLTIFNGDDQTVVLKFQDSGASSAGNLFWCPGDVDITIGEHESRTLVYNTILSAWLVSN